MKANLVKVINDLGLEQKYKLLVVINNSDYYYAVYTDIDNNNIKDNLYVAKVESLGNDNKTLPINDDEWKMLTEKYRKLVGINN